MAIVDVEKLAEQGRKEYYKQWRAKNKEHLKEYRKNYFAKKAAIAAEQPSKNDDDERKN